MKSIFLVLGLLCLASCALAQVTNCTLDAGEKYVQFDSTGSGNSRLVGVFNFGGLTTRGGWGAATAANQTSEKTYWISYQYKEFSDRHPELTVKYVARQCALVTEVFALKWLDLKNCTAFELKPNNTESVSCGEISGVYNLTKNCGYDCRLQSGLKYVSPSGFRVNPTTFVVGSRLLDGDTTAAGPSYPVTEVNSDSGAFWMEWQEVYPNHFQIRDVANRDLIGTIHNEDENSFCSSRGTYTVGFDANCTSSATLVSRGDVCNARETFFSNLTLSLGYVNCKSTDFFFVEDGNTSFDGSSGAAMLVPSNIVFLALSALLAMIVTYL